MRRTNPISVRVRAPSRGLITRLPSESADLFRPNDLQRASTNAQNVRYEDGVIAASPGYEGVTLGTSVTTPFRRFHQGNLLDNSWLTNFSAHADAQTPLVAATDDKLYWIARSYSSGFQAGLTLLFSGTAADKDAPWFMADFYDKVLFAQRNNNPQYWVSGASQAYPLPGLPTSDALWDGVSAFFGHVILWRGDRFKWSDKDDFTNYIPVGTTAADVHLTTSAGFTQPAANATVVVSTNEDPVAAGLIVGQFVSIAAAPAYNFYTVTAMTSSPNTVTLKREDLTDASTTGATISASSDIFTLNANEAGETRVVGSDANGPIFQFLQVGDYGFILKERSVTSVQYVGVGSGIFYLHTEFSGEGLMSRNSAVNLGDGRMVFLGHKELYQYSGGPSPTPICQQVTRQLYSELDRSRLEEILLYHNESRKEVWVYYPIAGGNKTLVWNYFEDTASFDDVPAGLSGITAIAAVDWPSDLPWYALADSQTWENFDPTLAWEDLSSASRERLTFFGSGDKLARVHGLVFTRDGQAYTALSETMDYDFGEPDIFKYVDVVALALQVKQPSDSTKSLYIQVGTKDSLDQDLRWTAPLAVDVKGNAPPPIKINPGGSGKYLRLRFYSQDADVQWRISSFEVHCRPGGFY